MEQIQAGSQDALGELYDRYCDRAYRIAFVVCSRADLAEEAVQDAFLSIWKSRGTYSPRRGTVAAWLLSCVRYRAIDVVRRTSARVQRQAGIENLDDHADPEDTAARVESRVEATRVRALLERLPDSQREVITLAFYGGLSHSEIATQLAVPSGTVKGRMRLGLHKLRTSLASNGVKQPGEAAGSMPIPPQIMARNVEPLI